ncbi:hypothetical protein DYB30_011832 [Aphanomyces astaci]|uniref:Uncharacterized protein n=1 Tax=Aphanomyces astaci TaxID=112090 RepID=A0A397AFZ5_APHAT|nr:hypothetical protein DYB36_002275 [Aphanomyces astaci]RHY65958.1 hypothetical protein DYB30_011832 [Aphanomyces astaci]RHZ10329.1 hypothetical protein DYB31_001953 [Aphanomyces astaci]
MTSGRLARGESWSFASFESCNEVRYEVDNGEVLVVLLDRLRLLDEPHDPLAARMGGMAVFGTVVLIGPRLHSFVQLLLQDTARKSLAPHQPPVPAGATHVQNVRAAVSPLTPSNPLLTSSSSSSGAIVRVAGTTTEATYEYMRALLHPLENLVGVRCFGENR